MKKEIRELVKALRENPGGMTTVWKVLSVYAAVYHLLMDEKERLEKKGDPRFVDDLVDIAEALEELSTEWESLVDLMVLVSKACATPDPTLGQTALKILAGNAPVKL